MFTPEKQRFAVLLVQRSTRQPIGLFVADSSRDHARRVVRHLNRRIRHTWPDRQAVAVPVL